jgi:hypothetical protein
LVLPALVAFVIFGAVGCGGKKTSKTMSFEAGDLVSLEGTLSLRGSMPRPILILETDTAGGVVIQSRELQSELSSLAGMKVWIEGRILPAIEGESPLIDATDYRLLALPSGEVPVVGVLKLQRDECVLHVDGGQRYWIRGEFTDLIRDFVGARMWVVGTAGDTALPDKPEGTIPLWVSGYGVLSQR